MRALPAGRENAGSFEPLPPISRSLGTSSIGVEIGSPKKKLLSHLGRGCTPQRFTATLSHLSKKLAVGIFGILGAFNIH